MRHQRNGSWDCHRSSVLHDQRRMAREAVLIRDLRAWLTSRCHFCSFFSSCFHAGVLSFVSSGCLSLCLTDATSRCVVLYVSLGCLTLEVKGDVSLELECRTTPPVWRAEPAVSMMDCKVAVHGRLSWVTFALCGKPDGHTCRWPDFRCNCWILLHGVTMQVNDSRAHLVINDRRARCL